MKTNIAQLSLMAVRYIVTKCRIYRFVFIDTSKTKKNHTIQKIQIYTNKAPHKIYTNSTKLRLYIQYSIYTYEKHINIHLIESCAK